ncbi:hypothetical protein PPM_3231 [Paenibacillus polymyxa M1]|nr:hypothetical protein PPM_3231 [Paenibacillus polymyxa M1]
MISSAEAEVAVKPKILNNKITDKIAEKYLAILFKLALLSFIFNKYGWPTNIYNNSTT